jgi:hypothetical protein
MNKTNRSTLLALLLAIPGLASAASETEANHPVDSPQTLVIGDLTVDGRATTGAIVNGVIGVTTAGTDVSKMKLDLDYFTFEGKAGDEVTIDIDNGTGLGRADVDTTLGLFGPAPTYKLLMSIDDVSLDSGSEPISKGGTRTPDAAIRNFPLPADGVYTVGVSGFPRRFATGGGIVNNDTRLIVQPNGHTSNGDYTLIVSGVTSSVLQISIEIKPGSGDVAPINPKSKGKVPVAMLGSSEFSIEDVDTASLTFGHGGTEASLSKCGASSDVDGDLWPDMVCHFENQAAQFASTDEVGILRGKLKNGRTFEGRGWLKIVPVKAQE